MNIDYNDDINHFIDIVSKDKDIDLTTFNNNLKTLKIRLDESNNKLFDMGYDNIKNEIFFADKETYVNSINHELFHCASTIIIDNMIYSGLYIWNKDTKLLAGLGLNEGYTEILQYRYFNKPRVYPIQTFYIEMLEQIIDPTILKKAYFSSDLRMLINEITNFNSIDATYKFIHCLDLFTITLNTNQERRFNEQEVQEAITYCSLFLASSYVNKLINERSNDILDKVFNYFEEFSKTYCFENFGDINLSIPLEQGFNILEKSGFKRI